MSFRKLLFVTICVSLLSLADAPAFAESDSWTKDDGYSFMDGSRPIKSSEVNGNSTEITFNQAGVQTPCKGKTIPAYQTRNVRVEPFLSCFGSIQINQERRPDPFEKMPGFAEIADKGDSWAIYKFMREKSKSSWSYSLPYSTNVRWTWTKRMSGKNGEHCGYDYTATTCSKVVGHKSRTCSYKADPPSNSSGGGGGGGGSRGGGSGGGGGGSYHRSNPFGFNQEGLEFIFDLIIPKAQAGYECSSWHTDSDTYHSFTCYTRSVRTCEWTEESSQSMVCTNESMPVTVELKQKPEAIWNPDRQNYVPFMPNGNDLLPGEIEWLKLDIKINGGSIMTSTPDVKGGEKAEHPSFYKYAHQVETGNFRCLEAAQNGIKWELTSSDRQVTKSPNSLVVSQIPEPAHQEFRKELSTTGLFNLKGESVVRGTGSPIVEITALPEELRVLDTSAKRLGSITAAFRRNDRGNTVDNNSEGQTVAIGQSSAGSGQKFWKETFYRAQLVEVFPGRSKAPVQVTEVMVQPDSLSKRVGSLITIPLAGQHSDTNSAFDLTSSGVVIPKGYFRTTGEQYLMIPNQAYELRLSLLHRGIPFYKSGCENNATACERETPNPEAFSDEKIIRFVYTGTDNRGLFRRYYDYMRRISPW